jgi:hypothetical protein
MLRLLSRNARTFGEAARQPSFKTYGLARDIPQEE